MIATLSPTTSTTLTAPAWGTAGCGAPDVAALLGSSFAAWGCRGIWVAPNWRARKGTPAARPGLDLMGDRQDCTVTDEALRGTFRPLLDAAVRALRDRVARHDYDSRESLLAVDPLVVGDHRVDLRVRVSGGYVYALVVARNLTADEAAEAAKVRAAEAEVAKAKREAAKAKREAARLERIVRERTAFGSFADLVATHESYAPTIRCSEHADLRVLADAFDVAALAKGQSRRAWRV